MYRTINAEFWTDPVIESLSVHARYLLLYCITNPSSHVSGIYSIRLSRIQEETKFTKAQCDSALDELEKVERIRYDHDRRILWVVNMLGYQGKGQLVERGVLYQLTKLHDSPLIPLFLERYPFLKDGLEKIGYQYPINTPSIPPLSRTSPDPVPVLLKREESEKGEKKGRGKASVLPAGFEFEEREKKLAEGFGLNVYQELASFKDHAAAKGRLCLDWHAAFRNWLRNSAKYKETRR